VKIITKFVGAMPLKINIGGIEGLPLKVNEQRQWYETGLYKSVGLQDLTDDRY